MSIEDVKTIFFQYIEAWNQKDMVLADRLTDECITPDAIFHTPGWPITGTGSTAQKAIAREMIAQNPDFHIAIEDVLVVDDKIILRETVLTNNPTTGAVESNAILEINAVTDGKIVESWSLFVPGKW